MVAKYAFSDEQAVLARVRYNRLIDVFLGIACYSLQNHLRTSVRGMGQVETDELYVGVDKRGVQYVIPVQAKSGTNNIRVANERRYRLVSPEGVTAEDLARYQRRIPAGPD